MVSCKIPSEEAKSLDLAYLRTRSKDIHYLKLHGSLDWWERSDKKIVLSDSEKPLYGEKLVNHIMIYPVYEKYISREPFFSLYAAFRRILLEEKIIIVMGYSFRDLSINNAFLDTLSTDEESRMIICAKSHAVRQRIAKIFQEYEGRIVLQIRARKALLSISKADWKIRISDWKLRNSDCNLV